MIAHWQMYTRAETSVDVSFAPKRRKQNASRFGTPLGHTIQAEIGALPEHAEHSISSMMYIGRTFGRAFRYVLMHVYMHIQAYDAGYMHVLVRVQSGR